MVSRLQVKTTGGTVEGTVLPGMAQFSAIPYALAPIGTLRWEPPVRARWQGTLDATSPGTISPQRPSRLRRAMGDFDSPQSEDCLTLTVWTPAVDAQARAVVVWLHGGAWQSGAAAIAWYNGERLAARGNIVVVSPNYRLAALGWLSIPGQPANLGLLDQELAIQWVIDNIEAFGGDPSRITVMGQSAGATSIACMLARKPLFKRAIMQSASLGREFRTAAEAEAIAQAVFAATGARTVEAARKLPVEALLNAQLSPQVTECLANQGMGRSIFAPILDGAVLPLDIERALKEATGKADVIIGTTRDEMAAFPGHTVDAQSNEIGDRLFGMPARTWAANAASSGRSAWIYRFDYGPNSEFGACHCIELPFVFDTLDSFEDAPMLHGAQREDTDRLVIEVQQSWLDFIRGGTPGWERSPDVHIFS